MPLLTNEWVTWKYFVDLLKEQLDMTGLSHDEILLILKEQNQEKEPIFRLGRRNKKAKEDMHNFEYLVKSVCHVTLFM